METSPVLTRNRRVLRRILTQAAEVVVILAASYVVQVHALGTEPHAWLESLADTAVHLALVRWAFRE